MIGWDLNGCPVELTGWQSSAVLALLGWDTAAALELPALGQAGRTGRHPGQPPPV